jgi:hypothetical protein
MPILRLRPELEDALRQIPGVRAVSVVTGPDAVPTEIHVVANHSKGAKQVVRDVQSLAIASYDLDIDHRIISVVQFDDSAGSAIQPAQTDQLAGVIRLPDTPGQLSPQPEQADSMSRQVIASISIRTTGSEADASIVITTGGASYEGRSIGPAAMSHRHVLVARATLDAVGELLGLPRSSSRPCPRWATAGSRPASSRWPCRGWASWS